MASTSQVEPSEVVVVERDHEVQVQLKHLGFLRILASNSLVLVSNIYDYAKQNSGSLKSTVGKVEDAVKAVVDPLYDRFKDVPNDLLVFLDNKVDEAAHKFDESAPPAAKNVVYKAKIASKKASQIAGDLLEEAKVAGPLAAISHASTLSKHFAVSQLALVWYKAHRYPALHGVSEMAIPTAAHLSEKYNKLVEDMAAKGYNMFNYVPLIPVEEMANAYKQAEAAAGNKPDTSTSSSSASDSGKE